jgi:hypothetical protein
LPLYLGTLRRKYVERGEKVMRESPITRTEIIMEVFVCIVLLMGRNNESGHRLRRAKPGPTNLSGSSYTPFLL